MRRYLLAFALLLPSLLLIAGLTNSIHAQSIVVDPGHGGNDSGGTGTGMEEKDIVLDTALRFLELLNASGAQGGRNWSAEITRDTDVFISLAARSSYANSIDADRFMSIHANAFDDPQANGTETFSEREGTTSSALRDLVQEEMVAEWGLRDRGGKTANFSVLTNTSMPATLSELGFVTNAGDAALLASLDARQRAAEAHVRALERHYEGVPEPMGTILVTVTLDEVPLSDIVIHLDTQEVGVTAEDGTLLLADLPVGAYQLRATLPDFDPPYESSVEVRANETSQGRFDLRSPPPTEGGCLGCSASGSQSPLTVLLLLVFVLARIRRTAATSAGRGFS